mgnify:CR=1 FL=1
MRLKLSIEKKPIYKNHLSNTYNLEKIPFQFIPKILEIDYVNLRIH